MCYAANRDGDNQRFVERYVCLTVPVLLRWSLLFYGIYVAALLGSHTWLGWNSQVFSARIQPVYMIYSVGMQMLFFLWVRRYIADAASGGSSATISPQDPPLVGA